MGTTLRSTLIATGLLLAAGCGVAGERSRTDSALPDVADGMRCLIPPPLAGLRLGDSVSSIRAALGRPIDSVRLTDHDTGGRVAATTYRFPRADVHVIRGRVDRVVVTEAGGWPRGLAVGSTRAEVDRYTGEHRLLRMSSDDTLEIQVCPDDWALLHFTPSANGQRVSRVDLRVTVHGRRIDREPPR